MTLSAEMGQDQDNSREEIAEDEDNRTVEEPGTALGDHFFSKKIFRELAKRPRRVILQAQEVATVACGGELRLGEPTIKIGGCL